MTTSQPRLLGSDIADLAALADEQAYSLTEMNLWAVDGGIEYRASADQMVSLMRHQTALSCMILTLANQLAEKPSLDRTWTNTRGGSQAID